MDTMSFGISKGMKIVSKRQNKGKDEHVVNKKDVKSDRGNRRLKVIKILVATVSVIVLALTVGYFGYWIYDTLHVYETITFNDKIKDIEKIDGEYTRIDCFISNLASESKDFVYATNKCYQSTLEDRKEEEDFKVVGDWIPVYMRDDTEVELTQEVVSLFGYVEVANARNFDYAVLKKGDELRTIEAKRFKGEVKKVLLKEYDSYYYVFDDGYGKTTPIKITNAKIDEYRGNNDAILNFNSLLNYGMLGVENDLLQQIYDKCENDITYEVDTEPYRAFKKEFKSYDNILGQKEINAFIKETNDLIEKVEDMNEDNVKEVDSLASTVFDDFVEKVTSIKLE